MDKGHNDVARVGWSNRNCSSVSWKGQHQGGSAKSPDGNLLEGEPSPASPSAMTVAISAQELS